MCNQNNETHAHLIAFSCCGGVLELSHRCVRGGVVCPASIKDRLLNFFIRILIISEMQKVNDVCFFFCFVGNLV